MSKPKKAPKPRREKKNLKKANKRSRLGQKIKAEDVQASAVTTSESSSALPSCFDSSSIVVPKPEQKTPNKTGDSGLTGTPFSSGISPSTSRSPSKSPAGLTDSDILDQDLDDSGIGNAPKPFVPRKVQSTLRSSGELDSIDDDLEDESSLAPVVPKSSDRHTQSEAFEDESSFSPVVVRRGDETQSRGLVAEISSDISPIVTKKEEEKKEAPKPEEKKEVKVTSASCVGGSFSSPGARGYQEDRFVVDDLCAFYGVYDGHGGDAASIYCKKHLKDYVMERMAKLPKDASDDDVKKVFEDAFIALDEKFLQKLVDDGSTACVGCVYNGKLYVANAGDSRAIIVCADRSVIEMSKDHKPDSPEEKKRIEAAHHDVVVITDFFDGKRIKIARVDGNLAVARSIGDGSLKDMEYPAKCAVTCVPEVRIRVLDPAKDLFLVVACDGIWDVYSNEEVADLVMRDLGGMKKPISVDALNAAAKHIVVSAIEKGSMDNCTAVVASL